MKIVKPRFFFSLYSPKLLTAVELCLGLLSLPLKREWWVMVSVRVFVVKEDEEKAMQRNYMHHLVIRCF